MQRKLSASNDNQTPLKFEWTDELGCYLVCQYEGPRINCIIKILMAEVYKEGLGYKYPTQYGRRFTTTEVLAKRNTEAFLRGSHGKPSNRKEKGEA